MDNKITDAIVMYIRLWLKEEGITWFRLVKKTFGTVSPVIPINHKLNPDKIIPHPVHFREGMQVRNALRSPPDCFSWGDHDFDDNWEEVVDKAIMEYGMDEIKKLSNAVFSFAFEMLSKLIDKYVAGYRGWDDLSLEHHLRMQLKDHVHRLITEDEPQEVDIANIAMFLSRLRKKRG